MTDIPTHFEIALGDLRVYPRIECRVLAWDIIYDDMMDRSQFESVRKPNTIIKSIAAYGSFWQTGAPSNYLPETP